jgi:hypothetical protein
VIPANFNYDTCAEDFAADDVRISRRPQDVPGWSMWGMHTIVNDWTISC